MLYFVILCLLVVCRKFVEDNFTHNNRVPILRWLFVRCNYLDLRRRLHYFDWLRHEFALAKLIPRIVLNKTLQEVLNLEKFGTDRTSKAV